MSTNLLPSVGAMKVLALSFNVRVLPHRILASLTTIAKRATMIDQQPTRSESTSCPMSLPERCYGQLLAILVWCCLPFAGQSFAVQADWQSAAPIDWQAAAKQDVAFVANTIQRQHIGYVAGHPNVVIPYQDGLALAGSALHGVKTRQDYLRLLSRFVQGFGDPHLGIDLQLQTIGWSGLVISKVAGQFQVVWSEPGWPKPLPAIGAVLHSCDGVWIGSYLKNVVAPYSAHSSEYAQSDRVHAQSLMFERGLNTVPKVCEFSDSSAQRRTYSLSLQAVPAVVSEARIRQVRQQFQVKAKDVDVHPLSPGRYWVGMPSFNVEDEGKAYRAMYQKLAGLKQADLIVFDLRGNGGGASSWGTEAIAALFGQDYAVQVEQYGGIAKSMIADQPTIQLLQDYAANPAFASYKAEMNAAADKLTQAKQAGEKTGLVSGSKNLSLPATTATQPAGPRLAALIDHHCFSSCMNFLQQLKAIPDTVVLGESTLGYSPYGEIMPVALPGGRGTLYVPTAFFTVKEAAREPFVPDYLYSGDLRDDAAIGKWIEQVIPRSR